MDPIERQAAIDVLHEYFDGMLETDTVCPADIYGLFECIPSAQPEIIHCRECKHGKWDIFDRGMWCELHSSLDVDENDFCSMAERRTDERSNQQTGGD